MKVKSLWISKYKNVEDINLTFNTELTTLLVGKNGLGKSNLIEALAIIFSELAFFENKTAIENFSSKYFDFEIKYICCGQLFNINIKDKKLSIYLDNSDGDRKEISFTEFKADRDNILPKYVIGYYSGENKRLKSVINKHESKEINNLKNWHRGSKSPEIDSLRKLFFAENFHGQILLITLALYQQHKDLGVYISTLFEKYLGIEKFMDFDITFKDPDWNYKDIGGINKSADLLIANINEDVENPFWNLQGKLDMLLTRLFNYQVDHGREPIIYDGNKSEFIKFSRINIGKFSEELYEYFPHPIDFFNALESTLIVNVFHEIKIEVKKSNLEFPVIYSELSEGEQQLVSVLGLILIAGKDDVLFLLDEPDTHLNPNWQRDYIRLLKDFNLNDDNSHIFVATHSPLIVQAVEGKYDILLYHLNKNGNIEIDNDPKIIANWRIDQVLSSKYFNIENTRPIYTDKYLKIKQEIIRKGEISEIDKLTLKELEDDLGYLPLGETITEIESLAFLNKLANKNDLH
ncbi:AAA family ATPase [Sphingobacterium anhuiense]|uniref:AAA family ATPase n=1 Tax=Sphingobacterium anhuiense TaxID=493780 RepID=UPI003C305C2B